MQRRSVARTFHMTQRIRWVFSRFLTVAKLSDMSGSELQTVGAATESMAGKNGSSSRNGQPRCVASAVVERGRVVRAVTEGTLVSMFISYVSTLAFLPTSRFPGFPLLQTVGHTDHTMCRLRERLSLPTSLHTSSYSLPQCSHYFGDPYPHNSQEHKMLPFQHLFKFSAQF